MKDDSDPSRSKKFVCKECYQITSTKSNHKRHMKKHSDEQKKFACDVCFKRFTTKFNLNRHISIYHKSPLPNHTHVSCL
ncbi:hypothetical protein CLU79DRAFT_129198 [Phycomyces nitens]|nr:hypothetical protein CLU79DRAFT_129198 [Phycomyces nitens]